MTRGDRVTGELQRLGEDLVPALGEVVVHRPRGAPLRASTSSIVTPAAPRSRSTSAALISMLLRVEPRLVRVLVAGTV